MGHPSSPPEEGLGPGGGAKARGRFSLQQRSKHPREMVITPKASASILRPSARPCPALQTGTVCIGSHHQHCPHYCNTIAQLLRNIRPPPDPRLLSHTPYNIGNGHFRPSARPCPALQTGTVCIGSHQHCPHYCNTIAQLLRTTSPPTSLLYAIRYTILGITISCIGQVLGRPHGCSLLSKLKRLLPIDLERARRRHVAWLKNLRADKW